MNKIKNTVLFVFTGFIVGCQTSLESKIGQTTALQTSEFKTHYLTLTSSETSRFSFINQREKCSKLSASILSSSSNRKRSSHFSFSEFDGNEICRTETSNSVFLEIKNNIPILIPPKKLSRVVVIGDTGCRLKNTAKGGPIQDCSDPSAWPLAELMNQVAQENADLIIHTGDYHYRENCEDPQLCKELGKVTGYGFVAWELDWLQPAKVALEKTPFIFVRGNHEDCQRAWNGYNQLIGSQQGTCLKAEPLQVFQYENLSLINWDNSAVADLELTTGTEQEQWLKGELKKLNEAIKALPSSKPIWLTMHRPVLGVTARGGGAPRTISTSMFEKLQGLSQFSRIKVMLSGHIHNFQIVKGSHPTQVIVGNSGTALDPLLIIDGSINKKNREFIYPIQTEKDFGYVVIDFNLKILQAKDIKGNPVHTENLKSL